MYLVINMTKTFMVNEKNYNVGLLMTLKPELSSSTSNPY